MSQNYTSWNIYTIKISYNNLYNLFLGIIRVYRVSKSRKNTLVPENTNGYANFIYFSF